MPLITEIRAPGSSRSKTGSEHLRGGGEWRRVVLDDGRQLWVDVEQVARHRLEPGEPVDPRVIGRLLARDVYFRARERALRLLAARPRSAWEIRERLARDRVPETTVRAVIAGLVHDQLLDDLTFARAWISRRMAARPYGARRIRWELRQRGVTPAIIDHALKESVRDDGGISQTEERSALTLIRGRLSGYRYLTPARRTRRIAALLERRGYAAGTIVRVLRTLGRAEDLEELNG
ncbi:MAG TPA: regulatory protein RecX [bacterium]|nr:regulatory protein RecX [bacterium]